MIPLALLVAWVGMAGLKRAMAPSCRHPGRYRLGGAVLLAGSWALCGAAYGTAAGIVAFLGVATVAALAAAAPFRAA